MQTLQKHTQMQRHTTSDMGNNAMDLLLGYIHAHERLFQMEFNRFLAKGSHCTFVACLRVSANHPQVVCLNSLEM